MRPPLVNHAVEDGDRALLRRQRVELPHQELRFRRIDDELVLHAIEGENLAAMLVADVGPDVKAVHERIGDEPLLENVLDERQVQRLGLTLTDSQQHVDARRPERIDNDLGHTLRGLLAQLPQDERGGLIERGNRSELEVEEDGDRNRHRDRQAGGEPQTAVVHQPLDRRGTDARGIHG